MKATFEFAGLAVTVSSKFLEYAPAPWQTPQIEEIWKTEWVQIPFDRKDGKGYTAKRRDELQDRLRKDRANTWFKDIWVRVGDKQVLAFQQRERTTVEKIQKPMPNNGRHKIFVKSEHGRLSFEFWASIAKPDIESEADLLGALYCLVSDATCAQGSFEDFCSELGYDSDSRKAYKVYKACLKQKSKLEGILGDTDLWDFANAVNERENG